jgi:putative ATP-binding cassette transporter
MFGDLSTSAPLVRLLRQGSKRFNLSMAAIVVLAGISNAALLAIVNSAAATAFDEAANGRLFALFGITLGLYIYAQRMILYASFTEVERLLSAVRIRVADGLRKSDLLTFEHVGRSEIYGIISRETQNISQGASILIMALQSATMLLFAVCYLALLSRTAFFVTAAVTSVGILLHFARSGALQALLSEAQRIENEFLATLAHLLDGFKETRMSRRRSDDLFAHLTAISRAVVNVKTQSSAGFADHFILMQGIFWALLAAIVFLLPRVGSVSPDVLLKLTAAVLFIIGPITTVVSAIPVYSNANVSAANIFALERRLEESSAADQQGRPEVSPPASFSSLAMRHIRFQYEDRGSGGFQLGPIDLQINAQEIVFIVGGNGSGKSTFLKALTALYHPHSGALVLDDTLVAPETSEWYRSHITAIFSDYHLFERMYGHVNVSTERVNSLLKLMQIEDRTAFEGGRFTNLELSSGQRKRLALAIALLEDRPILVLDEWAADQDPPFRKLFYEQILTGLRQEGKTIVAVTHDDRYFGVADRVLKMEYGQLVPYEAS